MSTIFAPTPIIDSDSRFVEPPDLWTSRLAGKWVDDAPRPQWDQAAGEERWRVGTALLRGVAEYAQAAYNDFLVDFACAASRVAWRAMAPLSGSLTLTPSLSSRRSGSSGATGTPRTARSPMSA
jgi:hypothetical protein